MKNKMDIALNQVRNGTWGHYDNTQEYILANNPDRWALLSLICCGTEPYQTRAYELLVAQGIGAIEGRHLICNGNEKFRERGWAVLRARGVQELDREYVMRHCHYAINAPEGVSCWKRHAERNDM